MSWVVGLPSNSYKPITNTAWVRARLCKLQKKVKLHTKYFAIQRIKIVDFFIESLCFNATFSFVNYKKWCIRLAATSDKVYQLLAHGQWFSPGTPASSTTKTGRHDIAEILLKVELKHPQKV
jgi:hypothetical protein